MELKGYVRMEHEDGNIRRENLNTCVLEGHLAFASSPEAIYWTISYCDTITARAICRPQMCETGVCRPSALVRQTVKGEMVLLSAQSVWVLWAIS